MSETDVLLVDEPSPFRERVVASLSEAGLAVDPADTDRAACERIWDGRYDCVVTEYRAPGIDGLSLATELTTDRDVPVVLFTDDGDEAVASEALAAGVVDYVPKPANLDTEADDALDRLAGGIEQAIGQNRGRAPRLAATRALDRMTARFFALDADWRFTHVNRAFAELVGEERNALLGRRFLEFFPDAADREYYRRYREAMADQEPATFYSYALEREQWCEVHAYPSREGLSVYFLDVTEEKRAAERHRDLFESWPDAVAEFDADGQYLSVNQAMADSVGLPRAELEGTYLRDHFDPELAADRLEMGRTAIERGERLADEDGRDGRYFHNIYVPVEGPGEEDTYQVISRDITARRERERELQRQRDELETLDRINAVIRDINRELVQASSREEIERVVCERLADSDSYRFAWIGEPDVANEQIEPRTSAGRADGYLEEIAVTYDGSEAGLGPGGCAVRLGEIQVVQEIGALPEPWCSLARERGFRSVAAIPLAYGDSLYGLLCVYAGRPYAFDDRETAVLSELGETIAYAINAVESKRALVADRASEVVLANRDAESFFIDASCRTGATITLEGVAESHSGALVKFCTVTGTDAEHILDLAEQADSIERARLVSEGSDADRFEFVYTGRSVITTLADYGAKVHSVVADSGESRIVAGLPDDADVRRVVEAFRATYPESELLAHRERSDVVRRDRDLQSRIDDRLTDRQLATLEAAYFGGFFEWPRDSSGEQLAESLGVSPPTFHQHLRAVQRKFAAAYLETRDSS